MRRIHFAALAAALAALVAAWPASAGLVSWDVDESVSYLRLTIPDLVSPIEGGTIRLRNANNSAWSDAGGRLAPLDGTIATVLNDGSSVEFLSGQHNLVAVEQNDLRPNPAAFDPGATNANNPNGQYTDTTTAPAAFGAKARTVISGITFDGVYFALRNVLFDLDSGVVPLGGGTAIGGNSTSLGISSSSLDIDALPILTTQILPDQVDGFWSLDNALNASSGSITDEGGLLRKLTLNVDIPFSITVGSVVVPGSAEGLIVAYATIPEPSTLALLGFGLAATTIVALRRRCRRR